MTVTDLKKGVKAALRGGCAALSPVFSRISQMDVPEARSVLESCWQKPAATAFAANTLTECTCDLQIVIPAYNVEDYLESCMESVLSQKTKYSFHVVLVDDGARDRTPEICDRYADHPKVTVIHQKNRGLSGARNTGFRELFGRYVLFVDSDDLLCEGAIEGLLDTAYRHDCDLVEGGAYYLIGESRSIMHRYDEEQRVDDPYTQLHGHAWGKLYRRELLAGLCFPEGYWYEDSLLSFLVFGKAKIIWVSAQMATAYRINQAGIVKTSVGKPRAAETYWITQLLLQERQEAGLPMDAAFFRFMLLQVRLNQLRLSGLEERVQESAFVLTCDLLDQYFPAETMTGRERNLIRALRTRDFGRFKMCCKFF